MEKIFIFLVICLLLSMSFVLASEGACNGVGEPGRGDEHHGSPNPDGGPEEKQRGEDSGDNGGDALGPKLQYRPDKGLASEQ